MGLCEITDPVRSQLYLNIAFMALIIHLIRWANSRDCIHLCFHKSRKSHIDQVGILGRHLWDDAFLSGIFSRASNSQSMGAPMYDFQTVGMRGLQLLSHISYKREKEQGGSK